MKRLTTIEFIGKSIIKHGHKYDYSKSKYIHSHLPVTIICPIHGEFKQRASKHLEGCGCKKCALDILTQYKSGGRKLLTTNDFIKRAEKIHHKKYDYSKTHYTHSHSPVTIICPIHGEFKQRASIHLEKSGCIKCANEKKAKDYVMDTEYFIERAKKVHGGLYNYDQSNYVNAKTKISIKCQKHGIFKQLPINHYEGCGCPKCFKGSSSKLEEDWLDTLHIPHDDDHRQVKIGSYTVDGYEPKTKTVYEFWGDFWHGHPARYNPNDFNPVAKKTFGELYANTEKKIKAIRTMGYNLVDIWESEWKSTHRN